MRDCGCATFGRWKYCPLCGKLIVREKWKPPYETDFADKRMARKVRGEFHNNKIEQQRESVSQANIEDAKPWTFSSCIGLIGCILGIELEQSVLNRQLIIDVVDESVELLSFPQSHVIQRRFRDGVTLARVGEELGVKAERIRQRESKALRTLRHSVYLRPLKSAITVGCENG